MTYRFTTAARRELAEAYRYYKSQQHGLGNDFLDAVRVGIQRILAMPQAYRLLYDGGPLRKCNTPVFPYGLIYTVEGQVVVIHAVLHLSSDPVSWRKRLRDQL